MNQAGRLTLALFGSAFALAACGDDGGSSGGGADAAPVTVTISGVTSEITLQGRVPKMGVAITVFNVADDSMITSTTSDAAGAFSVSTMSTSGPVDGYLRASFTGLKDTYLYPPGPLSTNFTGATVLMVSQTTQNLANQVAGALAPDASKGWVGVLVTDGSMAAIEGATVTASPMGEIHYNDPASGIPKSTATVTAPDGIGYVMNVAAGQVTVGATKAGTTFKSHAIKARADKVTLTLVTP